MKQHPAFNSFPWVPLIAFGLIAAAYFLYQPTPQESTQTSAAFTMCADETQRNCVIDGDTFRLNGERIRIEDIDAPEIFSPKCSQERALGIQAKQELLHLLNDGRFSVARYYSDDEDTYGRKLRAIERNGGSIGDSLVEKGLARRWNSPERNWCD